MIRHLMRISSQSSIILIRRNQHQLQRRFSTSAGFLNNNLTNNLATLNNNDTIATDQSLNDAEPIDKKDDVNRKLQILKLEVSVLRQEGRKAPNPDLLTQSIWDRLLELPSKSARYKYYTFLWTLEKKKENFQVSK